MFLKVELAPSRLLQLFLLLVLHQQRLLQLIQLLQLLNQLQRKSIHMVAIAIMVSMLLVIKLLIN